MTEVVIALPMPPTTNNLFAGTGRKRVRTRQYQAWENEASWTLARQRPQHIKGPVAVTIEVSDKDSNNNWDLCNREKATMDLLVTYGVIQGDHKPIVREFFMRWSPGISGVRVTIRALTPQSVNDVLRSAAERLESARA